MSLFGERDYPDDDDPFANTRMSFGDHIEDLRTHLLRAIYGFLICLVLGFVFAKPVVEFISAPVEDQLMKFYNRRVDEKRQLYKEGDSSLAEEDKAEEVDVEIALKPLARALHIKLPPEAPDWVTVRQKIHPVQQALKLSRAQNLIGPPPSLKTFTIMEAFLVYFKVAIFCGLVLSAPWIFYQIWSFVAAGLYANEKRLVNVYLPISLFLFLGGVIVCEWFVIPKAVEYLLDFNEWMGMEPELRLSDWLSFAIFTPLLFGVAFQTPMVMLFLSKIGMMTVEKFRKYRKVAWFILAVVAALIAASPDPISMVAMMIPMWGLYEFGIFLCIMSPRKEPEVETPEEEDMMVEV